MGVVKIGVSRMDTTPSVNDLVSHCKLEEKDLLEFIDLGDFNLLVPHLSEWEKIALDFEMSEETENIKSNNRKEEDRKVNFLKELKQKCSIKLTYSLLVRTLLKNKRAEDARCICLVLAGKLTHA